MTKIKNADPEISDDSVEKCQSTRKKEPSDASFPIIGIGASAGGLEALQLFLGNVPGKSGMAYIVVQHMDPTHKGFLVDLLDRITPMKVFQVKDGISVQPDCVYVIPPNKDMQLFHGALHLFDPVASRGLRLPIDFLFRSMADDRQEQAIGVILSGMGTDGTLGLKEIKEKGGAVFVQEPSQAKFDGMPRSAISSGLVDVVATVEELPLKIIAYLNHKPLISALETDMAERDRMNYEKIIALLRTNTGQDFSLYKKTTIYRRIDRRMGIHQIDKSENYIRFLQENPQEVQLLFKELLIGVTSFFRDPKEWEQLRDQLFPTLFEKHVSSQPLRAWVVGCSTGEEAYSLAMVFKEALASANLLDNIQLQIFATDLNRDAIDAARQGFYPVNIASDVSAERLDRFFIKEEQGYRINVELRNMVVFAPQNVIVDPPFTKIDIISCRNLLIYFNAELQKKLLTLFHYSLNPDGFLFLGSAETTNNLTDLFTPIEGKLHFYQRQEPTLLAEPYEFPSAVFSSPRVLQDTSLTEKIASKNGANMEDLTNQLILKRYSPAAVLVSIKGDILYTKGRTGKYLEPAAGRANWNIFAMAREGLHYKLHKTFQRAVHQNITVTIKNVAVHTEAGKQAVEVTVHPLLETENKRRLVLIVFTDAKIIPELKAQSRTTQAPAQRNRTDELEEELRKTRQQLHNLLKKSQTSKEECLSAYEELQSTNEELQSTSEEITTSKEEMQSLNEELQTLNYELQTKVDEMSQINNDMKNLLDSTDIATLFLDKYMQVRRYTPRTVKIFKLIPSDIGRPITDVVSKLNYPELVEDAHEVLRKLTLMEKTMNASDGSWFSIRIMPYRTMEDKIDGLVITFTDITESKLLEITLRKTQTEMEEFLAEKGMKLDAVEDPSN